jgi:glycosyltransferase involved in cell wall biosynthesis
MRKLKILFQCPQYLPSLGGIELNTKEISKKLINDGHEVSVFCQNYSPYGKEFEIIDRAKVFRYPILSFHKSLASFSGIIQEKHIEKHLKIFLKKYKFDIVFSEFFVFVKPTKNVDPNIPIVFLQPSITYIAFKKMAENSKGYKKFTNIMKSWIGFFLEKEAVRLCDLVLARSPEMKEIDYRILGANKNKIRIITQGIDFSKFKPGNEKNKTGKNILTVSRLSSDKNNKGLLRAFSMVNKNANLILLGSGPEMDELKDLAKNLGISDRVSFLGERKDVEKFYSTSDIFVLASKQEGFPNVFAEAMASGLPIIGFKSKIPEITVPTEIAIGNRMSGFAVKDEKEMAEKINLLVENHNLRKKMSKEALEESRKFSWDKAKENIIMAKILAKPLVSIVIPVFNCEKYIEETVQSILNQTMQDFEIILIDDVSQDKSLEIMQKLSLIDTRIKVFRNSKNSGAAASINFGLKKVRGEYVCRFDGDDIMTKNKLEKQSYFLDNNPKIDMVYSDMVVWYQDYKGNKKRVNGPDFKHDQAFKILRKSSERKDLGHIEPYLLLLGEGVTESISSGSAMFRARVLEKIKFDARLRNAEDYDFWFSLIGHGFKVKRLPFESFIYRKHIGQKSSSEQSKKNREKFYAQINQKLKSRIYFK